MIIKNFFAEVLKDYESNLEIFFDAETGAVFEPGRQDGTPRFLFTEVTGYAILDCLTLHSVTGNRNYLAKAEKSAEWIMNRAQDPSGGVLTRYYFGRDADPGLADKSFAGRRIFSFDVAICLRGMVALHRLTGAAPVLSSAVRMGDYLVDRVVDYRGEVTAIYDAAAGEPDPPQTNKWSRRFGGFHSKVGEALIELHEVTGDERYLSAARSICHRVLQFQSPEGNFETSTGRTELHPHCYATEGLLHVGRRSRDPVLIDAARRATEWALQQSRNGEIPQVIEFSGEAAPARFRTDALAQVLALASDLAQMGRLDHAHQPVMDQLAAKLLQMKKDGHGYFQYGFYEQEFHGKLEADTRSYWTNMFCLRALVKYYLSAILKDAYVAILAGGVGSRVWPISCENRPKPVSLSLLGDRSLLQETIRRFTYDDFIPPERVFVLCGKNALDQVADQAGREGVPGENCILESEPRGTIPAVGLALDGLPEAADRQDRLVIISMGDNVITPYARFQEAIGSALFAARENDCIVSIGKPVDKIAAIDARFGHHLYSRQINSYRSYEVPAFVEKPATDCFDAVRSAPGQLAWECGTVIFKESYYRSLVPANPRSGNLAEDLLSRAGPWTSGTGERVRLATALLDSEARFEDFGVPGASVRKFYEGHVRFDRGDGNICLGHPEKVRMLACAGNLIISDELPMEVYGLRDHLIIDNATTNTAIVMPLDEVKHLPNLYRLFSGSRRYEPFIEGGPKALLADPTTFVEKSPATHAISDFGLVFAYNISDRLSVHRTRNGLRVINEAYPGVGSRDFDVLVRKQVEDPRLVQHLIDVGALAKSLIGGEITLSAVAADLLNKLCLYHAIGGYLTVEGEQREGKIIQEFRRISKLDRHFLDSRIIYEIMGLHRRDYPQPDDSLVDLLSDNVNSAVQFLRSGIVENPDLRDILVMLMQVQDNPRTFAAFRKNLEEGRFGVSDEEVARIFACFKLAKNIIVGRWLWRRRYLKDSSIARKVFLRADRGDLEEFPFILSFSLKWLINAGIEPLIYIDRVNDLLIGQDKAFIDILERLQAGSRLLLSDRIYLGVINSPHGKGLDTEFVGRILDESTDILHSQSDQVFQYAQILELPFLLGDIEPHSRSITPESVQQLRELIVDFYHRNWRKIKPHVYADLISRLVA